MSIRVAILYNSGWRFAAPRRIIRPGGGRREAEGRLRSSSGVASANGLEAVQSIGRTSIFLNDPEEVYVYVT